MAKKNKKRQRLKKPGLPPGSIIFDGEQKVETATIKCIQYGPDRVEEFELGDVANVIELVKSPGVTWIDVVGVHDVELIDKLGSALKVHPLVLEDIASTGQRPKVEFYSNYIYAVVKMVTSTATGDVSVEQVSLVIGEGYVLSFQEREGDVFDPVRDRIRSGRGRIRTSGSAYLSYALMDIVVDHYFLVLGTYGDLLDDLEDEIIDDPSPARQARLRDLRKELIAIRRAVWPVREVVSNMERSESPLIDAEVKPFFRDVHDHAVQILDIVESSRDIVGGLMDLYLSSLSNRMNEIMKVLTIFGTIFLPLSFIVGMYGMNFEYMPELQFHYGYPILLVSMLLLAVGLLLFFKRKNWL